MSNLRLNWELTGQNIVIGCGYFCFHDAILKNWICECNSLQSLALENLGILPKELEEVWVEREI